MRQEMIEQGRQQLTTATTTFTRQLEVFAQHAGDGVQMLALDYPLRQTAKIDLPIMPQDHRSTRRDKGIHKRSQMPICDRVGMAWRKAKTLPRDKKTPIESR